MRPIHVVLNVHGQLFKLQKCNVMSLFFLSFFFFLFFSTIYWRENSCVKLHVRRKILSSLNWIDTIGIYCVVNIFDSVFFEECVTSFILFFLQTE